MTGHFGRSSLFLSTKMALFVETMLIFEGISIKTADFMDRQIKFDGLATKRGIFVEIVRI